MALLARPRSYSQPGSAAQQSIGQAAKALEVVEGADEVRSLCGAGAAVEIRPVGRHQRLAAVRQNEHELQAGRHYLIGIGLAGLGSAYMARKNYAAAESPREALEMYTQTLPPDHLNVAITSIELGRALLRQGRSEEAKRYRRAR